ncbi:MAG: hypothetical protein COA39_002640 [Sulfurimonas sp.]|nr:hypothetical protein [Sulfurimonas sp.]
MPSLFQINTKNDAYACVLVLRNFAMDFGFSEFDASLMANAGSELFVNSLCYANGSVVEIFYTKNGLGIEVKVDDNGEGIVDIDKCFMDGYTTSKTSLGLGLGSIKRSVDELIINKNDADGLSISLRKYINKPLYDNAEISLKEVGEEFNRDATFVKHYDGDKSLFVILDGAGHGIKTYMSTQKVKAVILENYRLPLDTMIYKCCEALKTSKLTRTVEAVFVRIKPEKFEYIILGNQFIRCYPKKSLLFTLGSMGKNLPKDLVVRELDLAEAFCMSLCSDGIEKEMNIYELYSNTSAIALCEAIYNHYNLNNDDDSSVIVIKRG